MRKAMREGDAVFHRKYGEGTVIGIGVVFVKFDNTSEDPEQRPFEQAVYEGDFLEVNGAWRA